MGQRNQLTQAAVSEITFSQHNVFHDQFKNHHLLIESALHKLLESRFRDPNSFDPERLNFPQCVALARALVGSQPDDHLWKILLKFNSVRNSLVHFRSEVEASSRLQSLRDELVNSLTITGMTMDVSTNELLMGNSCRIALWFLHDIEQSLPPP